MLKDYIRIIRAVILHILTTLPPPINLTKHILLIAPHPDDEIIGCAGLIQQALREGKKIDVMILSGGEKSHSGCCHLDASALIEARRNLSHKAAQIVGLSQEHLHFLNYPDGYITFEHPETKQLQSFITNLKPDAIFIPHKGESWSDHIEAGRIIQKITQDIPNVQLYEYCVWFWFYNVWNIDWKNARILKMSKSEHQCKLKAMDAYITPLAPCGNPWSGVLPKVFIKANQWNKELYFKVR